MARKNARRSIVAARDILAGEKITREMLTFKRPGTGISPAQIENIIGRCVIVEIKEDAIIQEAFLSKKG